MTQGNTAFLTVNEVAQLFRCDPETVKRQARSRKLPAFKFGKAWFFRPRDIDAMIDDAISAAHQES
ncbi:helix-turn-helix domain-containing protein [Alloacidobacterium dinghuense]|uniref:Helix-turn-helix domain-containing protein n=1 Tax=Alloacidobacterium dinghuense TaxID=2763107 RepID=A0A7G8BE82_9BACT|nr:helix-turn-helix domain-containing protein [Alloacidobacterium dinghuense]QNI30852.1 helix-turn-helix domain-containing protein [Alloacidobacterium dinghuense]